ncbi:MAG: D-alanyl-D-alanine endopeptidase, partial [Candidatus Magasanikbacteria bacterium]|nr:D-alanyl-D-alanine endopeptidase [Candidatus Magasanikbacteria bacterium]
MEILALILLIIFFILPMPLRETVQSAVVRQAVIAPFHGIQRGGDMPVEGFPEAATRPAGPTKNSDAEFPYELTAMSAIVTDVASGQTIFDRHANDVRPLASITKLMTALVFLDTNPNWAETLTLTIDDERAGHLYVDTGETLSLRDLFYVSLVGSSNNATVALSRASGLSSDAFVAAMNKKASDLGMTRTRFTEPTGLDSRNVSSAEDTAILLGAALEEPLIAQATTMASYNARIVGEKKKRLIKNTDMLLTRGVALRVAGVEGGKTGYIPEGGYNFAVQVHDAANHNLRIVILGAADPFARFIEAQDLAE